MSQITDLGVAQNVITVSIQHRAHGGTMPPDQAGQLQLANELVKMATDARAANVPSPVVGYVLQAAGLESADGAPVAAAPTPAPAPPAPAPAPPQANPFGQAVAQAPQPPAPPAPVAQTPPVAAPAQQAAATPTDINQVIPGYDDLKKDEILAALATLPTQLVDYVKAYEAGEGERAFVASFQPEQAQAIAPAATPAPAAAPAIPGAIQYQNVPQESESSTEPWVGYTKATVKDIKAIIDGAVGTHPDLKTLFRHIWTFEKVNKDRTSVFKKLEEVANNGVQTTSAPAPTPAPPQAAPQPDVHAEHPFGAAPAQPTPAPTPTGFPAAPTPTTEFGGEIAAPFESTTQRAEAHVTSEFILPDPQSGIPPIPEDFSALADLQIRQYASKFNAVQARLIVLLAQAKGHVADAVNIADDAEKKYIREWAGDAKATVKTQEAHAADTSEVSTARHTAREWQGVVRYYEALVNVYDLTCKRLSREQTDRQQERENAR